MYADLTVGPALGDIDIRAQVRAGHQNKGSHHDVLASVCENRLLRSQGRANNKKCARKEQSSEGRT